MIRKTALILFVAIFTVNMMAFAQNNTHDVTVQVPTINKVVVASDLTLNVTTLDQDWPDAPVEESNFVVVTNDGNDKTITSKIVGTKSDEIELQANLVGIGGNSNGYLDLSENSEATLESGFSSIKENGVVKIRATATPMFDPSSVEVVEVRYTISDE